MLAHRHQKRVVLVEEPRIARQVPLEKGADLLVAGPWRDKPMAGEDPPRVGVHDEDRAPQGVEQDAVGGLGADAGDVEQLAPERIHRDACHQPEASPVAVPEVGEKGGEPPRLDPEGPRWANEPGQAPPRERPDPRRGEKPSGPQGRQRALDVAPGGILGEDGAESDLEAALGRPPALRAEAPVKSLVEAKKSPFK